MNTWIRHAPRFPRRLSGVATRRRRPVAAVLLFSTEFLELLAKRGDASFERPDSRVIVGVDLAEARELRLRSDHFARDGASRIQHSFAFLLDVESVVLAGKLRKLIHGCIEISLCKLEPVLEEHAFAMRRGS